ncbi:MAG: sugar transferase [Lentimicrobium sp.]|jgi:lipopolysaccharide/colanic/teichoic acid biosynthesis glycosyltransferase|uniref:sugar transferase n=1 Tax=Lentimicrobium sp. TaxID=2034841 RepID=UPI0029D4DFB4|nr:sugar transferase [Lentimicrobium sp.]
MNSIYCKYFKRALDIFIALLAIGIFSPFFVLLTIILFIANRGNPFFVQERPGKDAKVFRMIKFKTLNDEKSESGELLPDAQRLLRIGRLIRASSLDELPQLFNILHGEMSIVGPRPLLVKYLPYYNEFQSRRHLVKPGITGWAQVNGRNKLTWDQKFAHDVFYVENVSLLFDIKILLLTVRKVILREGVNQEGEVTAEAFKGNFIKEQDK